MAEDSEFFLTIGPEKSEIWGYLFTVSTLMFGFFLNFMCFNKDFYAISKGTF